MKLSAADTKAIHKYLERLFDLHKEGSITRNAAVNDCAQFISQAALGDEGMKTRFRGSPDETWATMIRNGGC